MDISAAIESVYQQYFNLFLNIGLKSYGLEIVEQVAIKIKPNKNNKKYLETKRTKLGHLLDL